MSSVRGEEDDGKRVIAVLVGDIHLSHRPPVLRSTEKDWYACMRRYLRELERVALTYDAPILVAGDVFDHWNAPAELINFALDHMPTCYAIPGQHDLPFHNYDSIKRSAYWTLVRAGRITDLAPGMEYTISNMACDEVVVHPFPWKFPLGPNRSKRAALHLALCHAYVYSSKRNSYQNVSTSEHSHSRRLELSGFDVAVFGDNHKGFLERGSTLIYNCGTAMRRHSDDLDFEPRFGLLMTSGDVDTCRIDTSEDVYLDRTASKTLEQISGEVSQFVENLGAADAVDGRTDFVQAVHDIMRHTHLGDRVKHILLEVLERNRG